MKANPILTLSIATLAFLIPGAWAGEIIITADPALVTRSALAENGLDWALAPQGKASDAKLMVKGTFTQSQAAATQRALSGDGVEKREPFSAPAPADKQIAIPSLNKKETPAFFVTATPQPEGKIHVAIESGDNTSGTEATIASGDVMVVSVATEKPDAVGVYFVRFKND